MRQSQFHRLLLFTGCMLSMASVAAPTTDAPAPMEPDSASPVPKGMSTNAGPSDRNSDTRTIDLLVEMQQPTAGIRFNERASRNSNREGLVRPPRPLQSSQHPQIEAPPTPPSGLFGSGATPAVQTRAQNVSDRPSSGDAVPARGSSRPSSDLPPEVKRWLQWPRDIMEYLRENRGFVVGCTVMLLLVAWTGSMMFSRRRG